MSINVVEISDGAQVYRFRAETPQERWRAETMLVKEAGTIAWIRESVRPGEVFVDIGANVGMYSLMAARHVGASGTVYSFEPHAANFFSLLHNVSLNGLGGVIRPLSAALHDRAGLFDFHYRDWAAGTSMSQLGVTRDGDEVEFAPVVSELKYALPLDSLIADGSVRSPQHVKIDVDGNELLVLRGMRQLLSGANRPRTLQVEVNSRYKAELFSFLADCGYQAYRRHDTQLGQSLIDSGRDPEMVAHNALFRPKGAATRAA
jgi:FkbM family methyltransferase